MRTPIAWKNLVNDWRRLMLACAGIGFATVLMFMQNGFRYALLDSPVQMMRLLDSELVAFSRARYALPTEQRFPRHLIDLARAPRKSRAAQIRRWRDPIAPAIRSRNGPCAPQGIP